MLALFALSNASSGEPKPAGYWDREFPSQFEYEVAYNVAIESTDVSALSREVQKVLTRAGGERTQSGSGYHEGGGATSLSFEIPVSKAQAAAQKAAGLGNLKHFSSHKPGQSQLLPDIESRLREAESEKNGAGECAKKMAISLYFLDAKLARLRAAREALLRSQGKAMIAVSISKIGSHSAVRPR